MQSSWAVHPLNAESFSFNCTASEVKYFNLIFFLKSWEPLNNYHSVQAHAAMTLWARTSHYQVQLSVPIFQFTFVDLMLAMWRKEHNSLIGAKFPSSFSIPRLLPTSEICSAFVAVWDIFCFYKVRYHIKQVTFYHLLVWWIFEQSVKSLYIQASTRASTFEKHIFATT